MSFELVSDNLYSFHAAKGYVDLDYTVKEGLGFIPELLMLLSILLVILVIDVSVSFLCSKLVRI